MIDYDILETFGSDELMLRAIFQAPFEGEKMTGDVSNAYRAALKRHRESKGGEITPTEESLFKDRWQTKLRASRDTWEKRIQDRVNEGRLRNFQNYRWHYAADLAWDGPVFKEQVPLMLYAQGKVDIAKAAQGLKDAVGETKAKEYIETDDKGAIQALNVTKLGESVINLVRPYITRRKAALSNKFNDNTPWLSFESRSKTMMDKIRAAVTSQRIEMVTDGQGYRHEFTQWCHKMLMHSGQWVFVSHPWMREQQMRKVGDTIETFTTKEGPKLAHPHPTRTFYDVAHAPSTINNDNGVKYCGYWDILRYGDVHGNPNYFNTQGIRYTTDLDQSFDNYRGYFDAYYGTEKTIRFTPKRSNDALNASNNDRKAVSGYLAQSDGDCSLYFTHYYERVIPKDVGLGSYAFPVWVKLTVANDKTVVRARIMPSRPAFYMGHNEDDTRYLNASMAHEILPYQDQAQSLLSQMYYLMRLEQLVIAAIDTDIVTDKDMRRQIREYLKGNRSRAEAFYLEWSRTKMGGLKINPDAPVKFLTSQVQSQIATCITGLTQTLQLLERNLMMSPQELGQFVQRETSATENMIVEKTTNALYSYISQGPDEARAALKVILYESYMALGDDEVVTPVTAAFPRRLVEAAGFAFYADGIDGEDTPEEEREPEGRSVLANKKSMAHDFIFNSRDGTERTVSVEAAKTLYQFVTQILANKDILRLFGWKQITEMLSEVFRLSGSPYNIQLPEELPEGAPGEMSGELQAFAEQFTQQFTQLAEGLQQQVADVAESAEQNESNIKELESELSKTLDSIADHLSETHQQ